jgi:hypothetical protein
VNDAKGDFSNHSDVDIKYSPEIGLDCFDVAYKLINTSSVHILRSNASSELEDEVITKDGQVKFIWHPEMGTSFNGVSDGCYKMSPTSSTRTMLTQGLRYNFMVKTDLDKKHFRFRRRLKGSSVKHSLKINTDISEAVKNVVIPFYGYLPESLGFVCGDESNGSGVLFREIIPHPLVEESRQLIPYFSLYSRDLFSDNDRPLLIQLIEHNSHTDPLSFFVNVIVGFVQGVWVYLVHERGILPELHGQNALLEIDANGIPRRLIHRDFQSIYSDSCIRELKRLPQFEKHVIGVEDGITRPQQYSLVFDHEISRYLLERMVKVFVEFYPEYSFEDVAWNIADRFRKIPGNILDVFPQNTFRFSKQPMVGNSVTLVDTGERPVFR